VLILVDQMRYDGLGCNGNHHALTPNLDALAASGSRMTRCIAANPVCMPSRASLFTGRYPNGHGVWHNGVPLPRESNERYDPVVAGLTQRSHESRIISHVPTMPDTFADAGYDTHAIGKLHLTPTGSDPSYGFAESRLRWERGELDDWNGPYYGFLTVELSIGHGESAIGHYDVWRRSHFPEWSYAALKQLPPVNEGPGYPAEVHASHMPCEAHHSTWIADRACAYLEDRDPSTPFFLYLGFPDPHHPFTPPKDLADEFRGRRTRSPVLDSQEIDTKPEAVARLIGGADGGRLSAERFSADGITRASQYTDAMIHLVDRSVGRVLETIDRLELTDNTIVVFTSDHGDFLGDHGLILKDTIASMSLVHVPFVIRDPRGRLAPISGMPMSNVDVLPTLCDLTGVSYPEDLQGRSVLGNGTSSPSAVGVMAYQHTPRYHNFSLVDERFRFTWYPGTGERELYDHVADPHELRNVAGTSLLKDQENAMFEQLLGMHMQTDNPAGSRVARF
jgi:arylsulfatase A-like enzyme